MDESLADTPAAEADQQTADQGAADHRDMSDDDDSVCGDCGNQRMHLYMIPAGNKQIESSQRKPECFGQSEVRGSFACELVNTRIM